MKKAHKDEENLTTLRKSFITKTLKFTEKVIVCVTLLYICNWVVSVGLILWAIITTANFAYLDTLIVETSTTFRDVVGLSIIKFGVENIFKYNDFGGKVPNNGTYVEDETVVNFNDESEGGING